MVRGHIPARTTSCRSLRVHPPLREEGDQLEEVLLVIMRLRVTDHPKKLAVMGKTKLFLLLNKTRKNSTSLGFPLPNSKMRDQIRASLIIPCYSRTTY